MSIRRPISRSTTAGPITRGLILAAALTVAAAQTVSPDDFEGEPEPEDSESFFAGSLLPDGSILKDVVIPSYDENLKVSSTVTADEMTIVTRKKLEAKNLLIEFFNGDESLRAKITMKDARFRVSKKLLVSDQPVSLVSDDLTVDGAGLAFDTVNNRGFVRGPVKAVAKSTDTRTSMNARPARHALAAGALLMASAVDLPAQEKPLTTAARFANLRLSAAELKDLAAEAASRRPALAATKEVAEANFQEVATASNDARITMNSFLQAASLASLIATPAPPATGDVPRPGVSPEPSETTITSKDGAYFDATEGLLIFLKDVRVKNPQFQLNGADEVKAFMVPKEKAEETAKTGGGLPAPKIESKSEPEAEVPRPDATGAKEITPEMAEKMRAAKEAAKKTGSPAKGGEFGDVKRIVATGTVVVDFTPDDPEKSPVKASARTVIYDLEKELVILRGGSPWIVQDGKLTVAKGDDAYIFIYMQDGNPVKFVTGNQEMFETTFRTPEDSKKNPKNR